MQRSRSRIIVGTGVLCFVGVMALWLASSGDRAIADADKQVAIAKTATQEMVKAVALEGRTTSELTFQTEGIVQRLSVYVSVKSADARGLKVHVTSPSGTKVLLVGSAQKRGRADGFEAWLGGDGLATEESLAAFTGEPVAGTWKLTVDGARGQLTKWAVSADLSSSTKMAGMETYGEYGSGGGCDCRVGATSFHGSWALALLLLGLVAIRRR